jgi:hypothetical protein
MAASKAAAAAQVQATINAATAGPSERRIRRPSRRSPERTPQVERFREVQLPPTQSDRGLECGPLNLGQLRRGTSITSTGSHIDVFVTHAPKLQRSREAPGPLAGTCPEERLSARLGVRHR